MIGWTQEGRHTRGMDARPATAVLRRVRTAAVALAVLAGAMLSASPADAQYHRVRSVDVSTKHAQPLQRSMWARQGWWSTA